MPWLVLNAIAKVGCVTFFKDAHRGTLYIKWGKNGRLIRVCGE